MTEKQAKKQLSKVLSHFTPGSVLDLLGGVYADHAEVARQQGDAVAYDRCQLVQHALVVVGMGVDAVLPS